MNAALGALLAVIFFVSAASSARAFDAKQPKAVDLRVHPTGGKTPVEVAIGLFITNVIAIDEARESFEVGGYLTAKWNDPRLALPAAQAGNAAQAIRNFSLDEIWTPPIEAANSITHHKRQGLLEVDPGGLVTYTESFDAVLSDGFDLKKFPFDTQTLTFEFQPFFSSAPGIEFAPQPLPTTGISPEQHTELAAWRVKALRYSTDKTVSDGVIPPMREAVFEVAIQRRSGFYLWKIFLPLLLMTLIPVTIFWIDVKEFDWMLKVPMTMLLAMVAFEFAVARDLPRVGYLTFLDAVFLASFAFCFLCAAEITLVYIMQKRDKREPAAKIHYAGRWAYPLAYFAVLAALATVFLA